MKVFISYADRDKEFARQLAGALRGGGVEPFLAADELIPGMDIRTQIEREAASADAFVFVVGTNADGEPAQRFQWRAALGADPETIKPMIPVLAGDQFVPPFLWTRHPVRASGAASARQAAGAVREYLDHPELSIDHDAVVRGEEVLRQRIHDLARWAESMPEGAVVPQASGVER